MNFGHHGSANLPGGFRVSAALSAAKEQQRKKKVREEKREGDQGDRSQGECLRVGAGALRGASGWRLEGGGWSPGREAAGRVSWRPFNSSIQQEGLCSFGSTLRKEPKKKKGAVHIHKRRSGSAVGSTRPPREASPSLPVRAAFPAAAYTTPVRRGCLAGPLGGDLVPYSSRPLSSSSGGGLLLASKSSYSGRHHGRGPFRD